MNIANIGVGVYTDLARMHSGLREGQSAVLLFAGAAATAFGTVSTAAIAAGLAIDDALDGIRIATGATGAAMAGLEDSFNRVFANVPSSAGEASTAIAQLNVRTGQTGAGLEALSTQVLTLARITKSDLNATVADSAKVFTSWGIETSKQASTLDMVFRASQQTGIGVGELLQTMVTAGPVFRAAGFDFATSAALLGSFERAGVNGQRAVASLTAAFRYFGKEGKKLGVDAKTGISQTIARIQELGPGAESAALGIRVFGRSAVDMVAAIQSGRLNVDELVSSIANGTDTISSAAKATDGFTETLAQLRNNAVLALEPFGTAVLGTFNAAMVAVLKPSRALLSTLNLLAQAAIAVAAAVSARMVVAFFTATRAKIADFIATQAALRANVQLTAAVAAQAQAQLVAATAALNAARAETALTGSLVAQRAALVAVQTAHAQAALATAAHSAAMNAASLSARATAGAMNLLKGALAFFGGPLGLVITAVMAVVGIAFYNAGKKAREAAAQAREAADEFRAAIATMDDAAFAAAATVTRQNYRRTGQLIAQQRESLARAEALLAQSQSADRAASQFGQGKGVAPEASAATRAADAQVRRERANLEHLGQSQRIYAENVRTVREQEAALARQRASMPDPPAGGGPGPLDWESATGSANAAAAASERYAQTLQARASALADVLQAERAGGRSTASLMEALNGIYVGATVRLRGMGDAASLPKDALADYRAYLSTIQQLADAGVDAAASVRQIPAAPAMPASALTAVQRGGSISISVAGAEQFARKLERTAQDFGNTVLEKMEEGRNALKQGLLESSAAAASNLEDAAANVKAMWSGLLSNLPDQLRNFASMFSAIREKHEAQRTAGEAATGMAAFPGAVAFALAAEALAPVLEALREPLAALMVPLQMAAAAFGPLLTTVIKALFPIFKTFGIAVTYVAQVVGYVAGALLKVIGEIVRTAGSLIAKIPGLGQEGKALKDFGKGLVSSSKEMFDMAKAMPGVRDELRNLDWDEAMKRASESADRLADSLTNVPEVFNLIARQTQAMRGQASQAAASVSSSSAVVSMQAVASSVSSAAAGAGTVAARAITAESAQWKAALVEGAQLASQTITGAAVGLRNVLAGIASETPRQARTLRSGASSLAATLASMRNQMAQRSASPMRPTDLSSAPAPSPATQRVEAVQQVQVSVTVEAGAFPIVGSVKGEVEAQIRDLPARIGKYLADELNRPGTSKLKAAVRGVATAPVY